MTPMRAVPSMHKDVEQWARKEDEIRQSYQGVRRVFSEQKYQSCNADNGNADPHRF